MATARHKRIAWRRAGRAASQSKNGVGTRKVFESCMKRANTCRNSTFAGCVVEQKFHIRAMSFRLQRFPRRGKMRSRTVSHKLFPSAAFA
eukprot:15270778-Alexandrium_andersonii.AAC.1